MGSLLILWHAAAILIGPAPGSHLMSGVYPIWKPYLRFFHLENYWAFFAPDPSAGKLVRYVIEDGEGQLHFFKLTEELRRSDPMFLRHSSLYTDVSDPPGPGTLGLADYLARKHAELLPQRIQFVVGWQKRLRFREYAEGKRPLDTESVDIEYLTPIRLPVNFAPSGTEGAE